MKKILICIIGIISILSFYLFHDYKNITQLTFVNSIGIDYNEETKEYTMYFFILNNYTIAQTGNSASFTNTHAYTTKASDKEILLAENKIRDNSNTKFDLSHVRSFVIKTSFFKNDNILKLINYIKNSNKYSPSFEIYTTDDSLDELYKLENFSEVSGYYTILVNTQNNIPVKHVTYSDLCNDIYIKDYVVPYQKLKINKGIITDSEKEYIIFKRHDVIIKLKNSVDGIQPKTFEAKLLDYNETLEKVTASNVTPTWSNPPITYSSL